MPDLENSSFSELEQWLPSFISEARCQDGKPCPPNTLYLIMCAVQRHLIKSPDARFCRTVKVLDATLKELTRQSLGIKRKQADLLAFADERFLWRKGIFGLDTAERMLPSVFYYCGKAFG